MKANELADYLDGLDDVPAHLIQSAKDNGLVIVYGYSDDNIEIEGALREEIGAYDGGTVFFYKGEVLLECDDPCTHCEDDNKKNVAKRVEGHWNQDGYSWVMEAHDDIKGYPFDIMEDDEKFCKGLVFDIKDIA